MRKFIKSKIFLPVIISFSLLLSVFGSIFLLNVKNNKEEILADNIEISEKVKVQKVKVLFPDTSNLDFDEDAKIGNFLLDDTETIVTPYLTDEDIIHEVKYNGETVMLNNYYFDNGEYEECKVLYNGNYYYAQERLLITFNLSKYQNIDGKDVLVGFAKDESQYYTQTTHQVGNQTDEYNHIILPSVVAYLNGKQIEVTNITQGVVGNYNDDYFYQLLDLKELYYKNTSQPVNANEIEGEYRFEFTYNERIDNQVMPRQTDVVYFNLIDEKNYVGENIQPKLDTEYKIEREKDNSENEDARIEYAYYNYNEQKYPTITYNPERFALTFTKSLYDYDKQTFEYRYNGEVVEKYLNGIKQAEITPTIDGDNKYISVEIKDIGEYDIYFNYVVKIKEKVNNELKTKYIIDNADENGTFNLLIDETRTYLKKDNWKVAGDIKLYNYGYQLFHTDYSTEYTNNAEFKQGNQITDFSFENKDDAKNGFDNGVMKGIPGVLCSTNQAPVTFNYYAYMKINNNNLTESYALYFESLDEYQAYRNAVELDPTQNLKANYSANEISNIENNYKFKNNGYYLVFLKYTFEKYKDENGDNDSNVEHYQFFAFEINNRQPNIQVKEYNKGSENPEGDIINANGYTNNSVIITWQANTVFDIKPIVKIYKTSFNSNTALELDLDNTQGITFDNENKIIIDNKMQNVNGHYQVLINYGPNKTTVAKYYFTIDTDEIDGIEAKIITSLIGPDNIFDLEGEPISNTGFLLNWNEKDSGAKINVSYDYIALNKTNELTIQNILNNQLDCVDSDGSIIGDKTVNAVITKINTLASLNLYNGYSLNMVEENIPYSKGYDARNELNKITNNNSVKVEPGLYLFTLLDEAENENYYIFMIDNSKPVAINYVNREDKVEVCNNNESIIASKDSLTIWGDNKAIIVDDDNYLQAWLQNAGDKVSFDFFNNGELLLPIKHVIVKADNGAQDRVITNQRYDKQVITREKPYQDRILSYYVQDISVKNNSNNKLVNNNKLSFKVEMNTDYSKLFAFTSQDAFGMFNEMAEVDDGDRISNEYFSNKNYLYISWLENIDTNYEIESITYEFYPLSFDQESPLYPYASEPTKTGEFDFEKAIYITYKQDLNRKMINLDLGISKNPEGMYVIKRTYKNPLNAVDEYGDEILDYSPRYYTFFIERNKAISLTNSGNVLGTRIGYTAGSETEEIANYQVIYNGEYILEMPNNDLKFITSKLPLEWIDESILTRQLNKFSNEDIIVATIPNTMLTEEYLKSSQSAIKNRFNLYVKVEYKFDQNDEYRTQYCSTEQIDYSNIDFSKNGYYRITICDELGKDGLFNGEYLEDSTNIDYANYYSFTFRVNVETPEANYVKYNDAKTEYITITDTQQASVNNDNVLIGWKSSELHSQAGLVNGQAEISKQDYSITFTAKENGNYIHYTLNSGVNIYQAQNQYWDYYIDLAEVLPMLPNIYQEKSLKCDITLNYINKQYYNDYYSQTFTVVFDYNKPSYNYERLLNNDEYLQVLGDEVIENFENLNSDINFENYAFTVDSSYKLETMPNNDFFTTDMDTYKLYIRMYDKFNDDTIINQQSITPDDERYNEDSYSNHYRFNELIMINNKKIYAEVDRIKDDSTLTGSSYGTLANIFNRIADNGNNEYYDYANKYYELIEVDYAGNYRVYSIFVKEDFENTKLKFENHNDIVLSSTKDEDGSIISQKVLQESLTLDNISNAHFASNEYKAYLNVRIVDNMQNKTTVLNYSPFEDLDELLETINELILPRNEVSGNTYYITIHSSLDESLMIEFRKPPLAFPSSSYNISSTSNQITLSYYVNTNNQQNSAYIAKLSVYLARNGELKEEYIYETVYTNEHLVNGLFNYRNIFTATSEFGGDYWFVFEDNFGRTERVHRPIGVEDNDDKIIFNTQPAELVQEINGNNVNVQYTNDNVTIKIQTKLYSLKIVRIIGDSQTTLISRTNVDEIALIFKNVRYDELSGIISFSLFDVDNTPNETIYAVSISNSENNNAEPYYIGYYNIDLLNYVSVNKVSDGKAILNDTTIDRQLYLNINDKNTLFPVYVDITKTIQQNGVSQTINLGTFTSEDNGYIFKDIGKYVLTVYNAVNTRARFTFEISEKMLTDYLIVALDSNDNEIGYLTASATKYNYNNQLIPQYFTIYNYNIKANGSANINYEQVATNDVVDGGNTIATRTIYKISDNAEQNPTQYYISVSKVAFNNNFLRSYGNYIAVNNKIETGIEDKNPPLIDNDPTNKMAKLKINKVFNAIEGNDIIVEYYYNNEYVGEFSAQDYLEDNSAVFEIIDSGIYDFYFKDLAGNKQYFESRTYFRLYLLNDILFNLNGKQAVNNSIFNSSVLLSFIQINEYNNLKVTAKLNGNSINLKAVNRTYTFEEYGKYDLTLTATINNNPVVTEFSFTIINYSQAMAAFEYVGLNNYEIYKIVKYNSKTDLVGEDITQVIKQQLKVQKGLDENDEIKYINSLALSTLENGVGGSGYYQIFVEARYDSAKLDQEFSFYVWLNNDSDLLIKSSVNYGDATTNPITLTLNKNQIYNKVGECKIMFNNEEWLKIDAETAANNITEAFTITKAGVYNIRIVSNSGNTLQSFVITKNEPLNGWAIFAIVIGSLAVIALLIIFIKLRKNMRIK